MGCLSRIKSSAPLHLPSLLTLLPCENASPFGRIRSIDNSIRRAYDFDGVSFLRLADPHSRFPIMLSPPGPEGGETP
jgi:hypothetical protein